MLTLNSLPSSPEILITEPLGALLVHLLWADAQNWDSRRRLPQEEALALADTLAALLPEETRESLIRMRTREAA